MTTTATTTASSSTQPTINVKMVVQRFSSTFESLRKAIDAALDSIKQFYTTVGDEKKTKVGIETTCAQITNFLPGMLVEVEMMRKKHAALKAACEACMFTNERDKRSGSTRVELSRALNNVFSYVDHFVKLVQNCSVLRAAQSAIKHSAELLALLKRAKQNNSRFTATILKFIKAGTFSALVLAADSTIDINPREVTGGTKQQRREFLAKIDPTIIDHLRSERRSEKNFVVRDDDNGIGPPAAHDGGDDDDDGLDDEQEEDVAVQPDEDVVINADDEEDESDEEDDEEEDDDSGEVSVATAKFDYEIAQNNKEVLEQVQANAIIDSAGRALRQRDSRSAMHAYAELARYAQLDDDAGAKPSVAPQPVVAAAAVQANGGAVPLKRKRAENDDGEADGSAMSESSPNDEIEAFVAQTQSALKAQRAADKGH